MESWKQAFWLAKFELKQSKINFIYLFAILTLSIIITVNALPSYFEDATIFIDFAFIYICGVLSQVARPKVFQTKEMSKDLSVSHFLMMLNQQPIRKQVMVKYRFLIYFFTSVPFNVLFLIALYLFSPALRGETQLSTYLIFSVIWLCFSVYIGCFQPTTETGYNTKLQIILWSTFLGPLLFILTVILFYKVYFYGLVNWTLYISESYPFLSLIISLFLAIIGLVFWMKRMRAKMNRYDYL